MAKKVTPETKTTKTAAPKKAAAKTVKADKPAKVVKDKVAAPKKAAVKKVAAKTAAPKKAAAKKAATKVAKPLKKVETDPTKLLIDAIVDGMLDKKAHQILVLDLRPTGNSVADWFVICHGTSNTQADAIADSVEDTVRKKLHEKPWHTEGFQNAEWILLDYVNVVVHVFQEPVRDFYRLEDLWADAPVVKIEESF